MIDPAQARKRMMVMLAIVTVCAVVAAAGAVGAFVYHAPGAEWAFGGAILAGLTVQAWFIAGVARMKRGA